MSNSPKDRSDDTGEETSDEHSAENPKTQASEADQENPSVEENEEQGGADKATGEGAVKRSFARYAAPLAVSINGRCYEALDWSLGGFRLGDVRDLGLAGERTNTTILIKFDAFALSFKAKAELVRLDPTSREAGFRFTDLTDEQTRILSYFSSAFLAGRMRSIDGVLRHTRPDNKGGQSDEAENEEDRKAARREAVIRRIVLVLAAVAALFTARMTFLQMVSVDAAIAWIDTPMVTLSAPDSSVMIFAKVNEGDVVNPGDTIAQLVDSTLDAEIAYAKAEREQLAGRLGDLERTLEQRSKILQAEIIAAEAARDRARLRRANAADAVNAARRFSKAHTDLPAPQIVSLAELNAAERARTEAEDSLASADAELDQAQARLEAARIGYFYGDARSVGSDPAILSVEVAELKRKIEAEDVRITSLHLRQEEYALISPCRCKIIDLAVLPGERASPDAPIVRLHRMEGATQVAAFVRHGEVRHLKIGSRATVRLADGRVDTYAQIESVRASVRLVNELRLLNRELNPGKFSEVTVRLSDEFKDAPVAGAEVTMAWSVFGWLERAFYFSL